MIQNSPLILLQTKHLLHRRRSHFCLSDLNICIYFQVQSRRRRVRRRTHGGKRQSVSIITKSERLKLLEVPGHLTGLSQLRRGECESQRILGPSSTGSKGLIPQLQEREGSRCSAGCMALPLHIWQP